MHVRLASLLALMCAAAFAAPAAHAAAPAAVRMLSCDETARSVTYAARMYAVPDTSRMALRMRLLQKVGEGKFERVSAKGFDVWRKSRPGSSAFQWEHKIEGLARGATYRVVVRYRWYDAEGEKILKARRRSAACRQPTGLPNLRVAAIDTRPGEVDGTAVYKVTIANRGAVAAQNIHVLLRVDGEIVDEAEVIELLGPNETRTVTFNGPVCRRRMRVVVDPNDVIDESRERDNVRDPSCL